MQTILLLLLLELFLPQTSDSPAHQMNLMTRNVGRVQSSSLFVKRAFGKVATKNTQFRLRPLTRDDRPIIQKHRKLNDEHEQLAAAMGLPFRLIGAT